MRKIALIAVALAGCAPVAPLPGPPRDKCSAAGLGRLVGRFATPALVNRAKLRSGASIARILRPGQIVTMEYRRDRLNINVDGSNRANSFTCG